MIEKLEKLSLIQRILIAAVTGTIVAFLFPSATFLSIPGELFVNCLKGIAPILVFFLILSSVAKQEKMKKNQVGFIVVIYLVATFLASVFTLIASTLFPVTLELQAAVSTTAPDSVTTVLHNILMNIVQNPVKALIEGNYLSLLFWSTLLGMGLRHANPNFKKHLHTVAEGVTNIVKFIISFAPLGIFGLVYTSISTTGFKGLLSYGKLILLLVGCMLFTALVLYPLIAAFLTRKNPYPLVLFTLKESGVPAFFTRSSAANIPVNMKLADALHLDEKNYSISIPLGATINMGGAAITISLLSLAAVNTLHIEVPFLIKLLLCLIATLSACGASGVAGGSLLLIPLACSLFGISNDVAMQVVGVGFVISVVQDSFETALNSSSDLLFTAVAEISKTKKHPVLKPARETLTDQLEWIE